MPLPDIRIWAEWGTPVGEVSMIGDTPFWRTITDEQGDFRMDGVVGESVFLEFDSEASTRYVPCALDIRVVIPECVLVVTVKDHVGRPLGGLPLRASFRLAKEGRAVPSNARTQRIRHEDGKAVFLTSAWDTVGLSVGLPGQPPYRAKFALQRGAYHQVLDLVIPARPASTELKHSSDPTLE